MPKNTGTPDIPRNVGVKFSRGKYLSFLDNDDLFTKTALEELTTLAEEHQADVVHTDKFFSFSDEQLKHATTEELLTRNHNLARYVKQELIPAQTVTDEPHNLAERINLWVNGGFSWTTWALFCRRDFWTSNQIEFAVMPLSGDALANFFCLCLAKKILRVPNITYIYRSRAASISHDNADLEKYFHKWLTDLTSGFNEFNKIMSRFKFFGEHPDYRYAVFDWFFNRVLHDANLFSAAYAKVHPAAINPLVEKEFCGEDAAFAAYLFNTVNIQRLQIMRLTQENDALKKSLQQR